MKHLILATIALSGLAAALGTTSHKATIKVQYIEQPNGDYRVFLFGSDRSLVCEEKTITVVQQGDAVNPVVIECKH